MYYLLYWEMKYAFLILTTLKHTSTVNQKPEENSFIFLLFLNPVFSNWCPVANTWMS